MKDIKVMTDQERADYMKDLSSLYPYPTYQIASLHEKFNSVRGLVREIFEEYEKKLEKFNEDYESLKNCLSRIEKKMGCDGFRYAEVDQNNTVVNILFYIDTEYRLSRGCQLIKTDSAKVGDTYVPEQKIFFRAVR